jgi:opacity protein-like surface antigen
MLRLMPMKRLAGTMVLACLLSGCAAASVTQAAEEPKAAAAPQQVVSPQPALRTGPVGESGAAASCVESYNANTIDNRDFAFDGTISSIGPGGTNKVDKGTLDTSAVTFQVNEWFKGGTSTTVTVDLMSPKNNIAGDETPAYEQGTRLLVSGEPRWGGEPLTDAIAWSCGGFTRYYEAAMADEWRQATAA